MITEKNMSESRFLIQYDTAQPIELSALSNAFAGISRQYSNFIRSQTNVELAAEEVVLYVTKIENNCILTELAPYIGYGLTTIHVLDWPAALKQFADTINDYFEYFKALNLGKLIGKIGKRDAEDFRDFLAVVANNDSGAIVTEVVKYDEATGKKTSAIKYAYKPAEISEAYQGVTSYLSKITSQESNVFEKVLLYLPQLNVEAHKSEGQTADRGVIESISPKKLPVYWISDLDSRRIKNQSVNPHKVSYIVDVSVQTKNDTARAYSVLRLHDILNDDESQA
jgi:hypothetical protein